MYKQPWEAQGHRDSITSEELLKEIQRIPIQRGDGKGSFAVRSKTLQGSNDTKSLWWKPAFLILLPHPCILYHHLYQDVHIAKVSPFQSKSKQFGPFSRNHGTTMITPKTCSSSWNTTFCIFFLRCRLSRSNRWYSECILMEGDTHAFCEIFFATQSMASKPPAVTLGCKDINWLWTYENKRDIVVWTRLKHGIISCDRNLFGCLGDWPLCHKCGQWCQCLDMMLLMLRNLQHYVQHYSTCNILSRARIRRLVSQSARICKNVRLDNLFPINSRFLKLFTASSYKKFLKCWRFRRKHQLRPWLLVVWCEVVDQSDQGYDLQPWTRRMEGWKKNGSHHGWGVGNYSYSLTQNVFQYFVASWYFLSWQNSFSWVGLESCWLLALLVAPYP